MLYLVFPTTREIETEHVRRDGLFASFPNLDADTYDIYMHQSFRAQTREGINDMKVLTLIEGMFGHIAVLSGGDLKRDGTRPRTRCMVFLWSSVIEDKEATSLVVESCMKEDNRQHLVLTYIMSYVWPTMVHCAWQPKRVLVIGMGGATVSKALHRLLPDATVVTLEIDRAVLGVAKEYFDYNPDGITQQAVFGDAAQYLREYKGEPYDQIIVDAFETIKVAGSVTTDAFIESIARNLTPTGLLLFNAGNGEEMYGEDMRVGVGNNKKPDRPKSGGRALRDNFEAMFKVIRFNLPNAMFVAAKSEAFWGPIFEGPHPQLITERIGYRQLKFCPKAQPYAESFGLMRTSEEELDFKFKRIHWEE